MASSVIGSLRVNLGLDSSSFQSGLASAQRSLKGIGASMSATGKAMSLGVTAPVVGFAGLIAKTAGDFEASMNRVKAATGAPAEQLAALSEAARELGRTTQFSASEAADAIETLAKNGLSASQILDGALSASLQLAASSGADLASAGDIATDVMLQFGKQAADLGGVVDGITGVLLASKFGIDDYRLALGQAGGVAGSLGVEFDDFNAAIAGTSSLFASGSDAGTSFKTFLQRLVPQSKGAASAMRELGLEFFTADGSMKSISEVSQELKDGLAGLSEEAKNANLTTIFGTDGLRTAIGLANQGADGIDRLTASIAQASAADQASARMEGLNGSMKALASAFEGLQIAIAQSGLLEFVTQGVEMLTAMVAKLSETSPGILRFGTILAGLAAVLGPLLVTLGLAATAIGALSAPVLAVVAAVAGLTAGLIAFWPEISAAAEGAFAMIPDRMREIGGQILQGLLNGLREKYEGVKDSITGFATGMVDAVKDRLGIHSPSVIFREIGGFLMEGLQLGISGGRDGVDAAMTEATEGIAAATGQMQSTVGQNFKAMIRDGQSFAETMANILDRIADRLLDAGFNSLWSGMTGGGGLVAGIGSLLGIGTNANGTNNWRGGWTRVNERGGELMNLPSGTQIIPHDISKRMADGAAGGQLSMQSSQLTITDNGRIMAVVEARVGATLDEYSRQLPQQIKAYSQDPRGRS